MFKKLFFLITAIILISLVGSIQAEPFSLTAVEDIELGNDSQIGPNSSSEGSGLGARDIPAPRRRVFLVSYDISALKSSGQFSNVSFSHFSHDQHGETNVYGIIENLDLLEVESLTWNTAPGVQNDPTPALDAPVELDLADMTDVLLTFSGPGQTGVRFSTDTSQALADFLNSDTDGIITFLFAPAAENNQIIVRSSEHAEGGSFLEGEISPIIGIALDPYPVDGQVNVIRDVILSWKPGEFADTHDVYFGTDFDDVNNADINSPLLVSPAQSDFRYNAGRLEFGQTYFWRIDEVNAPPDTTVFKGYVWSFTVESFAYPIPGQSIITSASSYEAGKEPENTVNGSGLDNDTHSTDTSAMWLTAPGESGPAWIQYDFDKPFKLTEMLVWNYNGGDILYWYGLKDVTVEHSTDGINWIQISSISEFASATGMADYTYNTVVPFDGVVAQYVRITAASNWSGGFLEQYGLSEVRFMQIPVYAGEPNPTDQGTDAAIDVVLDWRAGRKAVEHKVYFSADQEAVADGTAFIMTTDQIGYGPLSLDLGGTYYWRIDEVNNAEVPAIWQGDTWNFTTSEYLVVDDFEAYNDITPGEEGSNRIFFTWTDGFDNPLVNGSTIGYPAPIFADGEHFVETGIVHGGSQSAPVFYDNATASISEVTVNTDTLPVGSNWTVGAPQSLVLWVYGDPNNAATEQMYVKVDNARVNFEGDLLQAEWQEFSIDLASLGINLSNVTMLTIGFERTGATGGSGMVFIDDIWLYTPLND